MENNYITTILVALGALVVGLAESVKNLFITVFLNGDKISAFGIAILSLVGVLFGFAVFKIITKIIRRNKQ